MADVSTITANGITYDIKDVTARTAIAQMVHAIYSVFVPSFSAFPVNVTDANITSDMVALECTFSNPSAIKADVTVTTADTDPQMTITGTINGSTTATIILGKTTL